jgi:N-acetyl-gamma-glutamylphosphate reductase
MAKKKQQKNKKDRDRTWQEMRVLIYVLPETKKKINKIGQKAETYNDIIDDMVDFCFENRKNYEDYKEQKHKKDEG